MYFILFFVLISCKQTSSNDSYNSSKELKNAIDTLKKKKDIKVNDFFLELSRKLNKKPYSLKKVNYAPNFKDILNDFVTENKNLFDYLDSEREAVFELNSGKTSIYIREWVFKNASNTKEIEKLINKSTRKVSFGGQVFFVDTIKEPYFTLMRDKNLYVFYVDNVGDSKHIAFFEELLGGNGNGIDDNGTD